MSAALQYLRCCILWSKWCSVLTKTGSGSPLVPPGPGTPPPACCNSSCESMKETGILPSHTSLLCSVSPLMLKRRRGGERERENWDCLLQTTSRHWRRSSHTHHTGPRPVHHVICSATHVLKSANFWGDEESRRFLSLPLSRSVQPPGVMVSYFLRKTSPFIFSNQ